MNCSPGSSLSPNSPHCCWSALPDHSVYGLQTLEGCSQVQLHTVGFRVKLQQQAHHISLGCGSEVRAVYLKPRQNQPLQNSQCRREFYGFPVCKLPLVTRWLIHSSRSFISKCKGSLSVQPHCNTAFVTPSLYLKLLHNETLFRFKCLDPLWLGQLPEWWHGAVPVFLCTYTSAHNFTIFLKDVFIGK